MTDEWGPRKGPRRLEKSSTRRRLCVVIDGADECCVVAAGEWPLSVLYGRATDPDPYRVPVQPGQTLIVPTAARLGPVTIFGPANETWGLMLVNDSDWRITCCPSVFHGCDLSYHIDIDELVQAPVRPIRSAVLDPRPLAILEAFIAAIRLRIEKGEQWRGR